MDPANNGSETPPASGRSWARIGGAWLEASIDCSAKGDLFDLALSLRAADGPLSTPALHERHTSLSLNPSHPRFAARALAGSEIVRLVGLLSAGEPADEPPPVDAAPPAPRRRPQLRRLSRPSLTSRPARVAGTVALLSLLFPGIAFVSSTARADGGGGTVTGSTVVTNPTIPSRTTPSDTTPTVTTPTDTTPTVTTPTVTTPTDTTPTDTTPTVTTPTEPTETMPSPTPTDGGPPTTTPVFRYGGHTTATPPVVKKAPKPVKTTTTTTTTTTAAPQPAPKPKKKRNAKKKAAVTDPTATLALNASFDPTPPALRLQTDFASSLSAVAQSSSVNWALILGVIRADGGTGSSPATEPVLESLALKLGTLEAATHPLIAAQTLLKKPALASEAVALSNYYQAVGLPTLVHGLEWAKPGLEQKVLSDSRVQIYPGGRGDIEHHAIDVRVLGVIEYLAQTYGEVRVSCLISGHGLYARPGVISAHHYGRAVDIAAIDNTQIAFHQQQGSITERAIKSILMLPPEMQPNQVISLLALGGPSFALSNHWDHIHVGFAAAPTMIAGGGLDATPHVPPGTSSLFELWQAAGATYGVPWQVLAAINKIESNFGQNMGPSSAGAVGWMQFMPSTWARWGVDANGDGIADPSNPADAIFSAARYLSATGASTNLPGAIFSYNHAQWYVNEVLQLATLYGDQNAASFSGIIFNTSLLGDEDTLPGMQLSDADAVDQPNSIITQWASARSELAERDDAYSLSNQWAVQRADAAAKASVPPNWLTTLPDALGIAGRALPGSFVEWVRQEGTLFDVPHTAPDGTYNLGVARALAVRAIVDGLQQVLPQVGSLHAAQAAGASVSQLAAPSSNSTGTP